MTTELITRNGHLELSGFYWEKFCLCNRVWVILEIYNKLIELNGVKKSLMILHFIFGNVLSIFPFFIHSFIHSFILCLSLFLSLSLSLSLWLSSHVSLWLWFHLCLSVYMCLCVCVCACVCVHVRACTSMYVHNPYVLVIVECRKHMWELVFSFY
jgi:hypothetical protein